MSRPFTKSAFTIAEMLVAVLLAAVITGTTTTIAVQTVGLQKRAEQLSAARWQTQKLADQWREDLLSTIDGLPDDVQAIELGRGDTLLTMFSVVAIPDLQAVMRRRLPTRVTYRLQERDDGGKQLIRSVQDLTSDASAIDYVMCADIEQAYVERFGEDGWTTQPDDQQSDMLAYRLRYRQPAAEWRSHIVVVRDDRQLEGGS